MRQEYCSHGDHYLPFLVVCISYVFAVLCVVFSNALISFLLLANLHPYRNLNTYAGLCWSIYLSKLGFLLPFLVFRTTICLSKVCTENESNRLLRRSAVFHLCDVGCWSVGQIPTEDQICIVLRHFTLNNYLDTIQNDRAVCFN